MSTVWVRFKNPTKRGTNSWHAVYVAERGGYFTYCEQYRRVEGVDTCEAAEPPMKRSKKAGRCRCCMSRMRSPYLVSDKLRRLKGVAA